MSKAVVGLGNPGPGYAATRHNAGWILIDHLARRAGLPAWRRGDQAMLSSGTIDGVPVRLAKPTTYMNLSGRALGALRTPGWDPATDLLILVDEASLPLGKFRIRAAGSAGGHNGLRSIEATLRSRDYPRLRIGVGPRPPEHEDIADFVLERFSKEERQQLDANLDTMADAVECWLTDGTETAMNRYNR